MSLPPNLDHRVWWIWPHQEPVQREQFKGKNFYFAVERAKVHFKLESTQLEFVLCDPEEINGLTPPGKQQKVDVWQQLGPKKPYSKSRQKRKKR